MYPKMGGFSSTRCRPADWVRFARFKDFANRKFTQERQVRVFGSKYG
jgi:hypothetical protein